SIFADVGTASWRDLQICHAAAPARVAREKLLEGAHPLANTLGIVEPIDPDDHAAVGETFDDLAHYSDSLGAASEPLELGHRDTYGECANPHHALAGDEGAAVARRHQAFFGQVLGEILRVVVGLEANQIVVTKTQNDALVLGQAGHDVRGGERNVQEE